MATSVVIVDKGGDLKDVSVKNFDIKTLYKKCNFRKAEGFEERHTYKNVKVSGERYNISVYARNEGKSGTENKYDLPPPIDTTLYFGNLALVRKDEEGDVVDLTSDEWEKVYEKLFGGFEDLSITAKEDEEEEDELAEISPSKKTKQGYLKDGFVVDTGSDEEEDSDDDDEDDDDNIVLVDSGDDTDDDDDDEDEDVNSYLQSDNEGSELDQEEFVFSDDDE